jgi:hypothetical protein
LAMVRFLGKYYLEQQIDVRSCRCEIRDYIDCSGWSSKQIDGYIYTFIRDVPFPSCGPDDVQQQQPCTKSKLALQHEETTLFDFLPQILGMNRSGMFGLVMWDGPQPCEMQNARDFNMSANHNRPFTISRGRIHTES